MKFEEVLPALRAGKKVRAKLWNAPGWEYIHVPQPFDSKHPHTLKVKQADGKPAELSSYDLFRNDWEVVETLMTFAEALKVVERGGKITKKSWDGGEGARLGPTQAVFIKDCLQNGWIETT